ncbi:hypothetical protein SSX86_025506 [Deinandra increscens subsp. villosa]|uniref:Uncharacterized protein n=1 Tax=Deinandra increscens subsp. villosa TaxID=3103831 RepID=A0AAP0CJB2_9ASTR
MAEVGTNIGKIGSNGSEARCIVWRSGTLVRVVAIGVLRPGGKITVYGTGLFSESPLPASSPSNQSVSLMGSARIKMYWLGITLLCNGALKLLQLFWETNTKLTIQNGDDGATIDFSFGGVRNLHELVAQEVANMGLDCLWIYHTPQ